MEHQKIRQWFSSSFAGGMIVGAAVLGAGLALGGAGTAPDDPDPVTTTRLEIVDELGTPVLVVGTNERGGVISVRDRFGQTVALFGAVENGASISMRDGLSGESAAVLQSINGRGGSLTISDSAKRSIVLGSDEDGLPRAAIRNAESVDALRFGLDDSGHGVLDLRRDDGTALVSAGATAGDHGKLTTFGTKENPLILLTADVNDRGQFMMYSETGETMAAIATSATGPTLRVYNVDGTPVITLESDVDRGGEVGIWGPDGVGRRIDAGDPSKGVGGSNY